MSRRAGFWVALFVLQLALVLPVLGLFFGPAAPQAIGALEVVASLAPNAQDAPDAPMALEAPEELRCRHYEGKTDQAVRGWETPLHRH